MHECENFRWSKLRNSPNCVISLSILMLKRLISQTHVSKSSKKEEELIFRLRQHLKIFLDVLTYLTFSSNFASQNPPILYCFSCETYHIFVGRMSRCAIPYLVNVASARDISLKNEHNSIALKSHLCAFLNWMISCKFESKYSITIIKLLAWFYFSLLSTMYASLIYGNATLF